MRSVDADTQWRGQPDTSLRRLWKLVLISVLVHVPLTPLAGLFGLLALLGRTEPAGPTEPEPPVNAIPIDLIADDEPQAPKPEASQAKAAEAKPEVPEERAPEAPKVELEPKPERPSAGEDKKAEKPPAKASGDPVALSGASKVADANANVQVLVFADRIRNHPLGQRIGELLGAADQWQDFFGPGGLDPIVDVDRILIAGPQLRDSSNVVAVLRHNSPGKVKSAVEALVQREPKGEWLDTKVPAARARADRAERVFVLASPRIVIVTPPSAAAHAIKVGPSIKFGNPKGSEALTTYVVTPWRAFIGIPFGIPKSIKWVRMRIIPTPDGGATAEIVAEDESEEIAAKNAAELTKDINALTQVNTGALGAIFGIKTFKVIEPVSFSAKGSQIHGTVRATPAQLGAVLEAVAKLAKDIAAQNARKARQKAAADAGTAPSSDAATPSAAADAGGD